MHKKWFLVLALTTLIFTISCGKNPTTSKNTAPTASFTSSPASGTTITMFTFDASGSSDNEDETSVLKVRWDWENDGVWDTDYRTIKTIIHQYQETGTYTVVLEVIDTGNLVKTFSDTVTVSTSNTVPTALFTISPVSGTVDTVFDFDASGSSDNEDETSVLQIRWDWENDGTYDTNFSTNKTATHQFNSTGSYTVKLEIKDTDGLTNTKTGTVSVSNTAPIASFTVNPTSGTVDTTFTFDASGSNDNEDETSVIQVRWDWENDGVWDTSYNTTKIASHKYSTIGTYTVKLEAKDSEGLTHSTTEIVTIQQPSTVVTFSDANFEHLIRSVLDKLDGGDVTDLDMETITALNGKNWNISDISGIEYCTNLVDLDLQDNQIIDISVLGGLVHLEVLSLMFNQIIDINALSGLTQLQVLRLGDNQIININSLSTLVNLTELGLDDNQIIDINSLTQNNGIDNGDVVYLTNNPLNATSVNTYIPQLETRGVTVHYGSGTVVTFSDANFEHLIRSILDKLDGGDITDSDLKTITKINGKNWNISDISGIEHCTNLIHLDLRDNQIIDISTLSSLVKLEILTLMFNQIIDISSISNLTELQVLSLEDNQVVDVSALSGLTNLVLLFLEDNQVVDVSALSGLTNLTELDMRRNQIIDISAFSSLNNLTFLHLGRNQIFDISALTGLTNLTELGLAGNQIVDIYALTQNNGIDNADIIYLADNPLNATSVNTYIPELEARGVIVHY